MRVRKSPARPSALPRLQETGSAFPPVAGNSAARPLGPLAGLAVRVTAGRGQAPNQCAWGQRFQHAENFSDFHQTVMRQHNATRPDHVTVAFGRQYARSEFQAQHQQKLMCCGVRPAKIADSPACQCAGQRNLGNHGAGFVALVTGDWSRTLKIKSDM